MNSGLPGLGSKRPPRVFVFLLGFLVLFVAIYWTVVNVTSGNSGLDKTNVSQYVSPVDLVNRAAIFESRFGTSSSDIEIEIADNGFISAAPDFENGKLIVYWAGPVSKSARDLAESSARVPVEFVPGKYSFMQECRASSDAADLTDLYSQYGLGFATSSPKLNGDGFELELVGELSAEQKTELEIKLFDLLGVDVEIKFVDAAPVPLNAQDS